jgi:hypothetical protein
MLFPDVSFPNVRVKHASLPILKLEIGVGVGNDEPMGINADIEPPETEYTPTML